MAGRPNYRGKRLDRERKKAAKRAAKQAEKAERTARRKGDDPDETMPEGAMPGKAAPDETTTESASDAQPLSASDESRPG